MATGYQTEFWLETETVWPCFGLHFLTRAVEKKVVSFLTEASLVCSFVRALVWPFVTESESFDSGECGESKRQVCGYCSGSWLVLVFFGLGSTYDNLTLDAGVVGFRQSILLLHARRECW